MKYKNGCEGARREGSCRCPYEIKGISAQIPDDESLSAGQGFHYFKLRTQGAETYEENRHRMISIQLSSFIN